MGRYLISISGSSADDDGDVSHPPAAGRPLSYLRGMIRRDSSPSRVAAAEHHQRTAPLPPRREATHTRTALAAGGNIRRDVREFHACHPPTLLRAGHPRARFNDV